MRLPRQSTTVPNVSKTMAAGLLNVLAGISLSPSPTSMRAQPGDEQWMAGQARPCAGTGASMKRLLRHPAMQMALARLLGWYLKLALRTSRWTLEGRENLAPHAAGRPAIVAFWHERGSMMPMLFVLARRLPEARVGRVHILVSRSRDGRLQGAVMSRFGLHIVQGSSSRGGTAALRTILGLLERGDHVALSPDGPRGPRRQALPGVAQIAALSSVPILPCAAQTSRRWELGSWDRFVVPLPFGRGVVVCGPPMTVARNAWRDAVGQIGDALTDAADRADRGCAG